MSVPAKVRARLKQAFRRNELTLFVGAGASVASGLPTWSNLVLVVFLNSLRDVRRVRSSDDAEFRAVAQVWFDGRGLPLDVVARQLRGSFEAPEEFLKWVRFALYPNYVWQPDGLPSDEYVVFLKENQTLSAIAELCARTEHRNRGLRRVVSYNFDNLLELRLGGAPHCSLWGPNKVRPDRLPIYHVHGFLPARNPWLPYPDGVASSGEQLVLTEDQYHAEAAAPYSWSNLTQLNAISDSVGLTVGLSLTDPNMRRILDISARSAAQAEIYALLARPRPGELNGEKLEAVAELYGRLKALGYYGVADDAASISSSPEFADRCRTIWSRLDALARRREEGLMRELGVTPLWCEHEQIPQLLHEIGA